MTSIRRWLRDQAEDYSADQNRPLAAYAGTMSVYAAVVGVVAAMARLTGQDVPAR